MVVVETTRGERIIVSNLTVFEIEGPFLIIKSGPLAQKYTLTEKSRSKINNWLKEEEV